MNDTSIFENTIHLQIKTMTSNTRMTKQIFEVDKLKMLKKNYYVKVKTFYT